MTETIAGIDPSTRPGICIMRNGKVIHAAGDSVTGKGWPRGKVNSTYRNWLRSALVAHHVDAFAVELPVPMGKIVSNADFHSHANYFWETAQALAHELNIEVEGVSIQSWRKFFLGTAVAPKAPPPPDHIASHRGRDWATKWRKDWFKQQAILKCSKFGLELKSHDAAESVGICTWFYNQRHPLGWASANDLFALSETKPDRIDGTIKLKTEADKVFSNFAESSG